MSNKRKKWSYGIFVFLTPILILLFYRLCEYFTYTGSIVSFLILYLPSILFSFFVIRKMPCNLLVLPTGFMVSLLFDPIWVSILWPRYNRASIAMTCILLGVIYSLPFTAITFVIAILYRDNHHKSV